MSRSIPGPDGPAGEVRIRPAELTPGVTAALPVEVVNHSDTATRFAVDVLGIETSWIDGPLPVVGPLAPGETGYSEVRLRLPVGHPACRLSASVAARPIGSTAQRGASTPVLLTVGDGSQMGATLDPPDVRGAHRGRFAVVLHNHSKSPMRVELSAEAPDPKVRVGFAEPTQVLAAGEEVRVKGQVQGPRPTFGRVARRPFGIRVQGRTTPVMLEGSFAQRPLFSTWLTKVVAVCAVVALWAAVAVVGISALDKNLSKQAHDKAAASAPPAPAPTSPAGGSGTSESGGGTAGSGSSGGSGSTKGSGNTSSGSGKSGAHSGGSSSGGTGGAGGGGSSGGSGSGSAGSSNSSGGSGGGGSSATKGPSAVTPPGSANPETTARVSGKVAAPVPGGVTVTISPTSLVDEQAEGATLAGGNGGSSAQTAALSSKHGDAVLASYHAGATTTAAALDRQPLGKVYGEDVGSSFSPTLSSQMDPTLTTKTTPDGLWAFAGLNAPGYYLVTFSKPGYQTQKFIVSPTDGGDGTQLPVTLTAASGQISGTIFGPHGRLGDVDVTVTDGTITAETKTPTVGNVGSWSIGGLNTPDTYLVSATLPGYGTQVSLVTLGAGGSKSGVDLTLHSGVGSITGRVTSGRGGQPVGGITVTATDGAVTRTATTTTISPIGTYALPDLTVPGSYALTVSGDGWVTQTRQVKLTGNSTVNAVLTPSSSDVTGIVTAKGGAPLAGAGVTLSNQTNTYKTLSESAAPVGGFDFGQVPPGQYVLTAQDYEYTTESAQVAVTAGQIKRVDISLPFVGAASQDTATIQGTVVDLFSQQPVGGAKVTIDGSSQAVTTQSDGSYILTGVGPGIHTLTGSASNHQSASVQVSVAEGATAFAPPIQLPSLDSIAGTVVDSFNNPVPNPTVIAWTVSNAKTGGTCPTPVIGSAVPTVTGCVYKTSTDPGNSNTYNVPAAMGGGYVIGDIPQGNYDLLFSGPPATGSTPECEPQYAVPPPLKVSLGLDQATEILNQQLTYQPEYQVSTYLRSTSTPLAGVQVSVRDLTTGKTTTCTSSAAKPTIMSGLVSGARDEATFSYSSGGVTYTAPDQVFVATPPTGSAPATAILQPPVSLSLQYSYVTPSGNITCSVETPKVGQCPSADVPTVTLTGTSTITSAPITAQAAPSGNGTWSFASQQTTIDQMEATNLTFQVTDPGGDFQSFTSPPVTKSDGNFLGEQFTLTPAPVQVSGTISAGTAGTSASGASVTVSGGATITLSAGTNAITWNQTGQSPLHAAPGIYQIAITDPGYTNYSTTGTLQLGTSPQTVIDATLTQLDTLAITVPAFTPAASSPAPSLVVSVTCPAGDTSCTSYNASSGSPFSFGQSQSLNSAGSTVTITDLDPTATYKVAITIPGYLDYSWSGDLEASSGDLSLNTASATATLTPTLVQEAYVTGTVDGQTGSQANALSTASVSIYPATGSPAACPSSGNGPAPVATDTNGNFTIVGSGSGSAASELNVGTGAAYCIKVTASGYPTYVSDPITLNAGANSIPTITLTANQITAYVAVNGNGVGSGYAAIGTTITVKAVSSVGAAATASKVSCPAQGSLPSNSPLHTNYSTWTCFSVQIDPTTYTFDVSAPDYQSTSIDSVPFSVGNTPNPDYPSTATLSLDQSKVSGSVSTLDNTGETVGMGGVTVKLYSVGSDGTYTEVASTTTSTAAASIGDYSFTSENALSPNPGYVPDGTYAVGVPLAGVSAAGVANKGYSYVHTPQSFTAAGGTYTEDIQISANDVSASVTVSSAVTSESMSGATVTLTPATGTWPATTCSAQVVNTGLATTLTEPAGTGGKTPFGQVVPGYYELNVSGTDGDNNAIPSQTATEVWACPGVANPLTFTVQEALVSGTVAFGSGVSGVPIATVDSAADLKSVAVDVYPGSATSGTATKSTTPASDGTYSLIIPSGTQYTVVASYPGFDSKTSACDTTSSPACSFSPTLTPSTHTVTVVAESDAGTPLTLGGVKVTLSDTTLGTSYQATTDSTGVATFSGVAADSENEYQAKETSLPSDAASTLVFTPIQIQVPVQASGSNPAEQDLTASFGELTGSVTDSAAKKATTITITATGSTTFTESLSYTSGTASYQMYLPADAYTVEATDTAGNSAPATGTINVSDGETASAGLSKVTAPPTTTTSSTTAPTTPPTT